MKTVKGKIILADNEAYEKELLERALKEKRWHVEVEFFKSAEDAFEYLTTTEDKIFLIISDVNMTGMSGLDLKRAVDKHNGGSAEKIIPFILLSNSPVKEQVEEAFKSSVHGYFKKPLTIEDHANMLDTIISYWAISWHPGKEEY